MPTLPDSLGRVDGSLQLKLQANCNLSGIMKEAHGGEKNNSKNKLCQPSVGAATKVLEGNSQCCCNWTLKYTKEGHVKFDKRPGL